MNYNSPLIKAFLNERCYTIDLGNRPSSERKDMIEWCKVHSGVEAESWQMIALAADFFVMIFMNHDDGVLFELTWC